MPAMRVDHNLVASRAKGDDARHGGLEPGRTELIPPWLNPFPKTSRIFPMDCEFTWPAPTDIPA
jgi:hypothetical protein